MKILLGAIVLLALAVLVFAGELYSQVGRYQTYWNWRNEQSPQPNELVYVALGDSTAQGIGANKPQNGYVGLIANELEKRSGKPVRLLNFSKKGAKLADAVERQLPLLEKCNIPENAIVTIEIGANDMVDFEATKFEAQLDTLISRLPKQAVVSDLPYFGQGRHKQLEANVEKANLIIEQLVNKHGLKLAALHEKTKAGGTWRDYAIDRFHPSNHMYKRAWAPAFLEKIRLDNE